MAKKSTLLLLVMFIGILVSIAYMFNKTVLRGDFAVVNEKVEGDVPQAEE
jgi:hypothetical protein